MAVVPSGRTWDHDPEPPAIVDGADQMIIDPTFDSRVAHAGATDQDAQRSRKANNRARRQRKKQRQQQELVAQQVRRADISQAIAVRIPTRDQAPERVIAHLGPTNSGKTHDALQALAEAGSGTYAAPLRMLAQEAQARLSALVGEDQVGLITGEERVNETAPLICCTAEMAPRSGDVLVLDEVHWADDAERGHAWTRLLASADYRELRLLGAPDALPLLQAAFPDLELIKHDRLGPLEWVGSVNKHQLTPGTVVIAFSRKAVLYLADRLGKIYGPERVIALYGAMPLASRRVQIARVLDGQADIVVATDVLGHGVNLPARTVLFAETEKFDGHERRSLRAWEAAQIAGRAGRYGLAGNGQVGLLSGFQHFHPQAQPVQAGLTPSLAVANDFFGFRRVERGRLRPDLSDLGVERPSDLRFALADWEQHARLALADHTWLTIEATDPARRRLSLIDPQLARLTLADTWRLAQSPLDSDHPTDALVLKTIAQECLQVRNRLNYLLPSLAAVAGFTLEEAEQAARLAQGIRWAGQSFRLPVLAASAADVEAAAGLRVLTCLNDQQATKAIGHCRSCGKDCAPWFTQCDRCHGRSWSGYNDWD